MNSLVTSESSLEMWESKMVRLESSSETWGSTEDWSETLRKGWWESSWDWPAGRETWERMLESSGSSWDSPLRVPGRECRETWRGSPETRAVVTRQG